MIIHINIFTSQITYGVHIKKDKEKLILLTCSLTFSFGSSSMSVSSSICGDLYSFTGLLGVVYLAGFWLRSLCSSSSTILLVGVIKSVDFRPNKRVLIRGWFWKIQIRVIENHVFISVNFNLKYLIVNANQFFYLLSPWSRCFVIQFVCHWAKGVVKIPSGSFFPTFFPLFSFYSCLIGVFSLQVSWKGNMKVMWFPF